jgi:hypothetical protein
VISEAHANPEGMSMTRYTGLLIGSSAVIFLAASCAPSSGADTTGGPTGGSAPTGGASVSSSGGGATTTGGAMYAEVAGGVSAPGGSSAAGSAGSVSGGNGGTGGGPASGGAAESGGAGGAGGAGPAVACPNGAVVCDDFESYPAMAAPPEPNWKSWTVGAATLTVDTAHAFSGTKAVHVHGQVSQSSATKQQAFMLLQGAGFPVSGTTIFIRFMVYGTRFPFTGFSGPNHTIYSWVGTTKGLTSPDQGDPGKVYGLADYNGVSIEPEWDGYYRDTSVHFKDANQADQWHCWEYEIDNAGGPPPGASGPAMPHIWEDGAELKLAEAGASAPYNAIAFEAVEFGLYSPQTDDAEADYWFDDVAVSKSRINCPPAK